ncbi:MAG: hypothetical protein ABL874_13210 [Sphingopyxis sp.]
MTTASKLHKHYNMLIDIAFWSFLIQSIIPWLRMAGVTDFRSEGGWDVVSAIAFYGTWLLIVFLIAARFMRDEYAQGLWQRAGATIVLILTALPMSLLILPILSFSIFGDVMELVQKVAPLGPPSPDGSCDDAASMAYFHGAGRVLFWTAIYQPFLFICLYKWQRWRDLR